MIGGVGRQPIVGKPNGMMLDAPSICRPAVA
jgi:hypothetical protein